MIIQVGKTYRNRSTGELFYIESMTTRPEGEEFNYQKKDGKTGVFASFKPMSYHDIDEERWEEFKEEKKHKDCDLELGIEKFFVDLLKGYKNGNKISMIKTIREQYGYGLKEAKDIVDRMIDKAGSVASIVSMRRALDNSKNPNRDFELLANLPNRMFVVQLND